MHVVHADVVQPKTGEFVSPLGGRQEQPLQVKLNCPAFSEWMGQVAPEVSAAILWPATGFCVGPQAAASCGLAASSGCNTGTELSSDATSAPKSCTPAVLRSAAAMQAAACGCAAAAASSLFLHALPAAELALSSYEALLLADANKLPCIAQTDTGQHGVELQQ